MDQISKTKSKIWVRKRTLLRTPNCQTFDIITVSSSKHLHAVVSLLPFEPCDDLELGPLLDFSAGKSKLTG